jgi:hypothetical protein
VLVKSYSFLRVSSLKTAGGICDRLDLWIAKGTAARDTQLPITCGKLSAARTSRLADGYDVRAAVAGAAGVDDLAQERRGDVPPLAGLGDDGDRLLVVARKHADDHAAALGLKPHTVADLEIQHLFVRARLVHEAQALDDAIIQIDQLRFGQAVDIDRHRQLPSKVG